MVITIGYTNRQGEEKTFATHPGGLLQEPGEQHWKPDRELSRWLALRLEQTEVADAQWRQQKDCISLVARAAKSERRRKPKQPADAEGTA